MRAIALDDRTRALVVGYLHRSKRWRRTGLALGAGAVPFGLSLAGIDGRSSWTRTRTAARRR